MLINQLQINNYLKYFVNKCKNNDKNKLIN